MEAGQLISALEKGKTIYLDSKYAFPEKYEGYDFGEFVKTIEMTPSKTIFRYGWGSALGRVEDEIMNIINHPEQYQIKP
jgi:hypothetical protein